ncbi:hypothetical protein GCM10010227_06050 [Streptomyces gougerotii]|nr:hypothetical protein GCM10010227_06050 [Streptomyces gougerotii]
MGAGKPRDGGRSRKRRDTNGSGGKGGPSALPPPWPRRSRVTQGVTYVPHLTATQARFPWCLTGSQLLYDFPPDWQV